MRGLFTNDAFRLDAGQVLAGRSWRVRILCIGSGSAWVTIEGAHEDYWLAAGDALRVPAGRLVVVEAQAGGLQMQTTSAAGLPARAWNALLRIRRARAAQSECATGACCA